MIIDDYSVPKNKERNGRYKIVLPCSWRVLWRPPGLRAGSRSVHPEST
jgi:hypothetical protein